MYFNKHKLHEKQKKFCSGNLRTLTIDVTARCNMKCSHCYAETFAQAKAIDLNILKKALDEARNMGVYHYVLQGGEPIEDKKRLKSIIEMCYPEESYINVVTNGWNMTSDTIFWLRDLNIDKIAFSLDSGIANEHDFRRKKGSHARVLEAIDNVIKAGLLASVSIVVTHQSLYSDGFKKVYEYASNRGIRMDVQIAEPVGKWDGKKDPLMTTEDSRYIKELQMSSPILANGQKMINRDIFSGNFDHCPAVVEFMSITIDGLLLPCNFLQYSLGSIKHKSIAEMRNAILKNKWFNGRHPVCLCGENEEFINNFIMPYIDIPKPLDAYKVFNLKEEVLHENI